MNPQSLYKEAIGGEATPEELKQRQIEAEVEQRNVEAWAQWRQLPQTQVFIEKLKVISQVLTKLTASYCANVPGVDPNYVRARLVEANLLHEIIDITTHNGQLKESLLKEYIA